MLGGFWELKNHSNVKLLWYEDMIKDMMGTIKSLSCFLGFNMTKEQEEKIVEFVKFDEYKQNCQLGNKTQWNEGEGHFIRKGKVGDWKNYMDGDLNKEWDNWIEKEMKNLRIKEKYPLQQ